MYNEKSYQLTWSSERNPIDFVTSDRPTLNLEIKTKENYFASMKIIGALLIMPNKKV